MRTLLGVGASTMRPVALALNILVASFTSFRYVSAGPQSTRLCSLLRASN